MVLLSKLERRARAKEAKERREESTAAAAKLAANIEAEVDGDAYESVTLSPHDTPPPSGFDDVEVEDSTNVERSVIQDPTRRSTQRFLQAKHGQ